MADTFTTEGGSQIVWRDRAGALHACEGATVHPGIRLIWTRCATGAPSVRPGSLDVPANGAWKQRLEDKIDCAGCLAAIAKAEVA